MEEHSQGSFMFLSYWYHSVQRNRFHATCSDVVYLYFKLWSSYMFQRSTR